MSNDVHGAMGAIEEALRTIEQYYAELRALQDALDAWHVQLRRTRHLFDVLQTMDARHHTRGTSVQPPLPPMP